ncbi:hypothetical protein CMUST_11185 [Corynebacterium mustelae]|uniref:Uncharacterized protein n=1 Tax=Corynebacterium mustelae TaxID=571915 RepID=A0A0G3H5X5_9CORY|nr:hypothetical protein CMUST_11185 [Corynebacterium mustelae]
MSPTPTTLPFDSKSELRSWLPNGELVSLPPASTTDTLLHGNTAPIATSATVAVGGAAMSTETRATNRQHHKKNRLTDRWLAGRVISVCDKIIAPILLVTQVTQPDFKKTLMLASSSRNSLYKGAPTKR